jgi:predicted RNA-binding Zn-ribbon protein involved in translation (DUF1610 family)
MSNAGLQSGQTAAATGTRRAVFTANDVQTLIANNLRSLICQCPATQQPVDLQVFADTATLTRIVSSSVRFRCPHCGAQHETQVAAARPEAIWVKPQEAHRARHRRATPGQRAKSVSHALVQA